MMRRSKVAVVGAGVVGVSTAVCVAEKLPSCSVTLLSDKFTPDTTSDGAAGMLIVDQYPDIPLERQRCWFRDSFDHLLAIVQSQNTLETGVLLSSGFHIFKEPPVNKKPYWWDFVLGFRFLSERELRRFPEYTFGQAFTTIKCECSTYLPWLHQRFTKAGGKVEQKKVSSLEELSPDYDVIVNCSGLGSKDLVADNEVYPVRGQILKMDAPWLHHFIRLEKGTTYIYPGSRYVTLGGTRQEGDWRLGVDPGDSESILKRCTQLEPSLRGGKVLGGWVGFRPSRRNPRVEREVPRLGGGAHVVHNYGHGGFGVALAWGTAIDATGMVRSCLQERYPHAKL
ncbi:D-aspartate oxidase isoform X1 [Syngnathus typhle]|uniref:D-aspartate oxidase isoform X1 n=2 Tax=Syngnathus typhle TaxID=161592 RepID=UPI002A6B0218|nr:D-aspartate oxidase isoform X1 [Syngnathus typhle]